MEPLFKSEEVLTSEQVVGLFGNADTGDTMPPAHRLCGGTNRSARENE
jgi:hypothetical protein